MGLKGKKGVFWDTMAPWVIAIGFLVLSFFLYKILSGKSIGVLEYFKIKWRFGT